MGAELGHVRLEPLPMALVAFQIVRVRMQVTVLALERAHLFQQSGVFVAEGFRHGASCADPNPISPRAGCLAERRKVLLPFSSRGFLTEAAWR
jgi:hypothetical protein